MDETEVLTLTEMQDLVDKLRVGSAILFSVLQEVFNLHDIELLEDEEETATCGHCTSLSGEIIAYPCPTAQILLKEFAVSQPQPDHQDQQ